ncbi:lipopolysaccharide biosynthesis protein [Granulicella mallensis]|uniref:Polysaccharide biosynthesis protein n=1 Tax=Granulicella mallensis (strain ATCC BAA-1857 / DSM 23137 / MP5ACTX8) TaxID=682795 RepID=G8NZN2_GRAMM|nr:polysaccharide biosynthesis C-terminal domain-containing protein [Granulicella mallensis]AEU39152.1 polysaccharide biosynthesis protein [Granulicella mallensis MP5ACTX8]
MEKKNDSPNIPPDPSDFGKSSVPASTIRTISKNASANLIRQGSAWVLVLVLPPLLVRTLGKDSYAIWVLTLQMGGYIFLVDSAIQGAVGRFVAQADSRNDLRYMSQMVSSALVLLLVASCVATVALLGLAWKLPDLLQHSSQTMNDIARRVLLIIGFSYIVTLPFAATAGIFVGLQRNAVITIASTTGKVISAVGTAWAALHHWGLVWMASLSSIGVLVQPLIYWLALRRLPARPQFGVRLLSRSSVRVFFSFSAAILLTQFTSLLISGLDMPIVTAFDFQHAAYYAIATTLSNMLMVPYSAIITPVMPIATAIHSNSTPEHLGRVLLKVTRFSTCLLCLLGLFLSLGLHPMLSWWISTDYASHAATFAEILILAQIVRLTLMPYALVGFSAGQQRQMLLSPIGEGVVNLACSVIGASLYGAVGVALGTLVGAIAGAALHFFVSMKKTSAVQFSRVELLLQILRPTSLMVVPMGLFLVIHRWLHGNSSTFALTVLCEALAAGMLWRMVLRPDDRRLLTDHLQSRLLRLRSVLAT